MKKSVLNIRFRIEFDMVPLSTVLTYQLYEKIHLYRSSSVKKVFLEISQNSQENTCARVSFLMMV